MPPISVPERLAAVMLIGTALLIGLYPRLLLDLIVPSLDSELFQGLLKVGLK
jgi:NADH-quinone oxidoreductase subunit M